MSRQRRSIFPKLDRALARPMGLHAKKFLRPLCGQKFRDLSPPGQKSTGWIRSIHPLR